LPQLLGLDAASFIAPKTAQVHAHASTSDADEPHFIGILYKQFNPSPVPPTTFGIPAYCTCI
jgi:hypothetical protein